MADIKRKVPNLRFKGFTDDWEQRKLGDVVNFFSGLTYHPSDVKNKGYFVIRSSNIQNNQIVSADDIFVNKDIINVPNVKQGDIIVVVRNGSRKLIGKHAQVLTDMPNTVIGAFMTGVRSKSNFYINALLDSDQFQKEIYKNLGATINQITIGEFRKMRFIITSGNEAQTIGEFFKKIDTLITLQQRKLDLLKQLKKGFLQKMFAEKNSKQPVLRFKGFHDDWEQRKLGDITKTNSFKPYISEAFDEGKYEVIQQGDNPIAGYANNAPFKDYKKVTLFGDHTLSLYKPQRAFLVASDGIKILSPSLKMDSLFYYYLLEKYKPHSEGYKRHFSILKKNVAFFPVNIAEQTKISHCLSNFDSLITLHQRKQNHLKLLKKSLLQQMFM
ncbi:hypothetical protein BHL84_07310 [Limosilactobacillus reuteri]|nr:hypothetical protein BHL84_07310 [Limosilactobacillus reuteri]